MSRSCKDCSIAIRNEICLDIATLMLRWVELTDIVQVVVQNIGETGNDYILLNVLGMLPFEVMNKKVSVSNECGLLPSYPFLKNNEKLSKKTCARIQIRF